MPIIKIKPVKGNINEYNEDNELTNILSDGKNILNFRFEEFKSMKFLYDFFEKNKNINLDFYICKKNQKKKYWVNKNEIDNYTFNDLISTHEYIYINSDLKIIGPLFVRNNNDDEINNSDYSISFSSNSEEEINDDIEDDLDDIDF